jgi:AraC-like DNA-binding protein
MFHEIFYPSPELQDIVTHYVVVEFTNTLPDIPCTIPKGACALGIVYSNESLTFVFDNPQDNYTGNTFISGYTLKVVKLGFVGRIKCIVAFFTPLGIWQLFGFAPGEFVNRFISVEDIAGSKASFIIEQLKNAKDVYSVVRYLDSFLKNYIRPRNYISTICEQSTALIQNSYGKLRIEEIIHNLNQCPRRIDRHFEKYLGVSPKQYAWLTRLNSAFTMMMYNNDISIHEIILSLGYFDQAHLINDVKKYMGTTPHILKDRMMTSVIATFSDNLATSLH